MPRFSLRQHTLKQINSLIVLFCANRAELDDACYVPTSAIMAFFFTALSLISTSFLRDDDSGSYKHQESVIMFDMMIMTLTNMTNISDLLNLKREQDEDDMRLSTLLLIQDQAYNRRYLLPRIRRMPAHCKSQTFNGWFHETERTWLTVVGFLPLLLCLCQI